MKLHNLVPLALAGAALLSGCGGGATPFNITVIHKDCLGGSLDNFTGKFTAAVATVTITGKDMDPVEQDVDLSSKNAELPLVPYGEDRVVEVRLFKDKGKKLQLGYGVSPSFDALEGKAIPDVPVVVYPLYDATSFTNRKGACAKLVTPRAGASATLLKDGRVLVAGGYKSGGWEKPREFLETAEIIDPRSGLVEAVAPMCPNGDKTQCSPRAYGPAVTLPDGRVLIAGGMILTDQKPDSAHALIYDPRTDKWKQVLMNQARRFNTATALWNKPDKVLVIGGVADQAGQGALLKSTEIFDGKTDAFTPGIDTDRPIARHSAAYFTSRHAIGIAGGITLDGDAPAVSDMLMAFDPSDASKLTSGILKPRVVGATVFTLGTTLYVVGGSTEWDWDQGFGFDDGYHGTGMYGGYQTWDGGRQSSAFEDARLGFALGCGATLTASPQSPKVTAGRGWTGGGINQSGSVLEGMSFATVGSAPSAVNKPGDPGEQNLTDPRADHSCVRISDRQILVIGGWGNSRGGSNNHALETIEMFTVGEPIK